MSKPSAQAHRVAPNCSRVGLLGASLGTGNRGVSALSASVIKLCSETGAGTKVALFIGNKSAAAFSLLVNGAETDVKVVNYRMSAASGIQKQLFAIAAISFCYRVLPIGALRRAIRRMNSWIDDAVSARWVGEIRGGDSFSDIYGLRRFILGTIPVLSVIWVRKNIVLLPQTYGPFKHPVAKWVARYVLNNASVILSRDQDSIKVVEQLTNGRRTAQFCPDVAFVLESIKPADPQIEPPLPKQKSGCLIGLNVNGLVYNGGYTRANMFGLKLDYRKYVADLLHALLADPNNRVLLVPHTFAPDGSAESDPAASRELMNGLPDAFKSRVHIVNHAFNQNEIKGVIGMTDFFVGTRMHACIAAVSQCIPTVAVAYSKKFAGVFDSVGVGECVIDARTASNEDAMCRTLEIFKQRQQFAAALPLRIDAARAKLRDTFAKLV